MDSSTTTSTSPPHRKTTTFTLAADNERNSDDEEQSPVHRTADASAAQNELPQGRHSGSRIEEHAEQRHDQDTDLAGEQEFNEYRQQGQARTQPEPQPEEQLGEQYGDDQKDEEALVPDTSSDLIFKKKDLSRSRAQSFQSVLSTASLKSLKQQVSTNTSNHPNNTTSSNRANSITANNTNTSKNFQSFIQAPVLSSVSNLKNDDYIEIGQQLPFNDNKSSASNSGSDQSGNNINEEMASPETGDGSYDDQDTIIQQQKLTINALKKLSLSPMLVSSHDSNLPQKLARKPSQKKVDVASNKAARNPEPYKPAEVDLSSFASLTRQPKLAQVNDGKNNDNKNQSFAESNKKSLPKLEEDHQAEEATKAQEEYHRDLRSQQLSHIQKQQQQQQQELHEQQQQYLQQQLQQSQPQQPPQHQSQQPALVSQQSQIKIPAAVIPPQSMNTRRQSNNVPGHGSTQSSYVSNLQLHNQALPASNQHAINQYKLAQAAHHQQLFPPQNSQQPTQNPQSQQYPQTPGQQPTQGGKSSKQLQQIKGLRSPMYVPAVLRMTVNSLSPTSSNISSNLASNVSSPGEGDATSPKQNLETNMNSLQNHHELEPQSSTASIRSFDSGMSTESSTSNKLNLKHSFLGSSKNYEDVLRAPPTRKHWVKDEVVFKCSIPQCPKVFNFFERRHHCRKCGGIYCKEHTSHFLYINHLAQFTTGGRGTLSKVCDNCISEYNEFIQHEFGVSINNSSQKSTPKPSVSEPEERPIVPKFEHRATQIDKPKVPYEKNQRNEQLVGSVPANWSWSSF